MVISVGLLSGCTSNQTGVSIFEPPVLTESEATFKDSCIPFNYETLNSNPSSLKGMKVNYIGIVLQVISGNGYASYRIDIGEGNEIYVNTDKKNSFIENDKVELWGKVLGSYTYDSIAGWTITLPNIWAFFIEELNFNLELGYFAKWAGLEVSVVSAERTDYYYWEGSSGTVYTQDAGSGDDYIIVNIHVRYSGKESEYVSSSDFSLVDPDGYKFNIESRGSFDGMRLYDGEQNKGQIIFEVPETGDDLKVQFNFGSSYNPLLAEWPLDV